MMKRFENQSFDFFMDESSGRTYVDLEFVECKFAGGGFSSISMVNFEGLDLVRLRSRARHIRFFNCRVEAITFIGPGIVEDTLIDTLSVSKHLQTTGTVFKNVVLRGRIDKIMITPYVDFFGKFPDVQKKFDDANAKYYSDVDMALDISEALFKDCDIRGIPSSLIRRDPETQVVLTRTKALEFEWQKVDLRDTHWPVAIDLFLKEGHPDIVLIAPKKSRNFKKLVEGLNCLRRAGIVN